MLFFKECKKVIFSLTFIIYCVTVFSMYFTQFHVDAEKPLQKPVPGLDDYGMTIKENPEVLIPAAIDSLISEYLTGSFKAYPYGFYKEIHLKEKDKTRIAEIISEISGITPEQLDSFEDFEQGRYIMDESGYMIYIEPNIPEVKIPESLTYEHFRELMNEVDEIIGGGSDYSDNYIVGTFSRVPKTYEDALAEYEQFIYDDKITAAYARLYCDYLGIVLSIIPVFVAVALTNLDRKSRMEQLAYSRKISSAKLFFTRYFSLVSVLLIPVLFTTVLAHMQVKSIYSDYTVDNTAFIRYTVLWLLPNIMTASAVGMLITEMVSGLLAIFVQGAWWFASTIADTGSLTGNIGKFTLVMRHNSLSGYDIFNAQWSNIMFNRIFFTVLSILAIALTALIYEQKRRGAFNGFQISKQNFKRKSKA